MTDKETIDDTSNDEKKKRAPASRVKYEDIVKSNQEVKDGYAVLSETNRVLSERLDAMAETVRNTTDGIARICSMIESLSPSGNDDAIKELYGKINELSKCSENSLKTNTDGMKTMADRIGEVETVVRINSEGLEKVCNTVDVLTKNVPDNTPALERLSKKVDDLSVKSEYSRNSKEKDLNTLTVKMVALETAMKSNSEGLTKVIDTVKDLPKTVPDNTGSLEKLSDGVSEVSENQKKLGESLNELSEKLSKPDDSEHMAQLRSTVEEIAQQTSTETKRIEEMSYCLREVSEKTDATTEILKKGIDEIAEMLKLEEQTMAEGPVVYDDFNESDFMTSKEQFDRYAEIIDSKSAELVNKDLMTSREQFDRYAEMIERKSAELVGKDFIRLLEQLAEIKTEFQKSVDLCEKEIDKLSPREVLDDLSTFLVDFDNVLMDSSIEEYCHESPDNRFDSTIQKMVGVTSTNDPGKDGTVSIRVSPGYRYGTRIMVKEKVNIYKYNQ